MTRNTFPLDPADMPALKHWLASQDDPQGLLRSLEIDEILIGPDALLELPAVLRRAGVIAGAQVVVVVDETPMLRERQDLKPWVQALLHEAGYQVRMLWLKGDVYGLVHADQQQIERVQAALDPEVALVALGSGTVTDIAKHAAYLYDQQHPHHARTVAICCPTANSVTAYAANMAVILVDGVKRTLPSRYPTAILADLRVLASAPHAMSAAGVGDCCARFVAYGDWYLAGSLGLVNFYSEVPLFLLHNLEAILLEFAGEIGQRSYAGEAVLVRALLLAGIAQSIVNMSAPVSGTEHVISHVLDMLAEHSRRSLALHGAQVGVATITAARFYQRFLEQFDPATIDIDACYPQAAALEETIQRLFQPLDPSGAMARECWNEYHKKLTLWQQNRPHFERFCANWQTQHRQELAALVCRPESVHRILQEAGAPLNCQELNPPVSQHEYEFAVSYGQLIRSRFVLTDLLYFLGWNRETRQL